MLSRQQFMRYEAQQPSVAPVPRKLSFSQRLLTRLLWLCLIPFLLLGFLLVGELPRLKS